MTLGAALNNAYSGLRVSATRVEVTANNIANAETDGFARRSVVLSSTVVDGRGLGVRVQGVEVASADVITQDRRVGDADLGAATVDAETTRQLSTIIGGPDDPGSLFARYQGFEDSLRLLSGDPTAGHLQTDVLNKATDIVEFYNSSTERVSQLRSDLDVEIGRQVDDVNRILVEIADLNKQVRRDAALGAETSETASQRNMLIDQISSIIPIQTRIKANGVVSVQTTSGFELAAEKAKTIEFSVVGNIQPNMDLLGVYQPGPPAVPAPNGISGLTIDGVDVTPLSSNSGAFSTGSLAGLFEARDQTTVDFQRKLDTLARDLVQRFDNTIDDASVGQVEPGLPNPPADTPGIFSFTGAITDPGLAGALQVNPLVVADVTEIRDGIGVTGAEPGDNSHVVTLLRAFELARPAPDAGVTGSGSADALVADVVSLLSVQTQRAEEDLALRQTRSSVLIATETAAIGVDTDFELQELSLIQTAYSANARVMQVVDELFRQLLEL